MSEIRSFVEKLTRVDYALSKAAYGGSEEYDKIVQEARHLLADGMTLGLPRVEDPAPGWLEARQAAVASTVAREVFQIKRHDHPELGRLFRAYVSGDRADETGEYHQCWLIVRVADELTLLGKYAACWDCSGAGRTGADAPCLECGTLGFDYLEGKRVSEWGRVSSIHKLKAPTPERQRFEYELD